MTAIKSTPQKRTRTLSAAKSQFTCAVTRGIEELMHNMGYSRERATTTLLRELGRGGESPSEDEIFHMMELRGLGMEDAAKALVVSKAVRRAMKEEGFSAVEAIDDLTSKLSVANLLVSTSPATTTEKVLEKIVVPQRSPSRRAAPATTIAPLSQQLHRKPSARKTVLKKQAKPSILSVKNPRKRSLSDDQKDNAKIGRARTDSVTEEVNAKIAETRSAKQSVKRKEVTGSAITGPAPAMKRPKL